MPKSQEKYQPTPEEIQKAETTMTDEQRYLSELREEAVYLEATDTNIKEQIEQVNKDIERFKELADSGIPVVFSESRSSGGQTVNSWRSIEYFPDGTVKEESHSRGDIAIGIKGSHDVKVGRWKVPEKYIGVKDEYDNFYGNRESKLSMALYDKEAAVKQISVEHRSWTNPVDEAQYSEKELDQIDNWYRFHEWRYKQIDILIRDLKAKKKSDTSKS